MTFKNTTILSALFAFIIGVGLSHGLAGDDPGVPDKAVEQQEAIDAHDYHKEDVHPGDGQENHIHTETGNEGEEDISHPEHLEDMEHGHDEEEGIIEMTEAQQKEVGLFIAAARPGTIQNTLSFSGEVRLNEDQVVHIVPLVSGIVRNVFASLGETVREGQELARIDSPELAEMKADFLEKLRDVELARSTFERKEYLFQENIASKADRLEAKASFQNAETLLLSVKQRLLSLGLSDRQVLDISDDESDNFSRYQVSSPITGTVIARHITRGEKIDGSELFVVADLSRVWVDLQVPARDIRHVREGLGVEVISAEGRRENGKLSLVGPVINEESRTSLGRVILDNPDRYWKPGQFVTGRILSDTASTAVVIPSDAVQNIDGEAVVFVPDGDGFRSVDVVLGRSSRDMVEIVAGIEDGDRYVAKGAFSLKAIKVTSGLGSHAGHGH